MSSDPIITFILPACVFGLLSRARRRADLVAISALIETLIAGVVPAEQAFSGFGQPATAVVAAPSARDIAARRAVNPDPSWWP